MRFFHSVEKSFPLCGKIAKKFSIVWKKTANFSTVWKKVFHTVENPCNKSHPPSVGCRMNSFSLALGSLLLACGLLAAPAAAQREGPARRQRLGAELEAALALLDAKADLIEAAQPLPSDLKDAAKTAHSESKRFDQLLAVRDPRARAQAAAASTALRKAFAIANPLLAPASARLQPAARNARNRAVARAALAFLAVKIESRQANGNPAKKPAKTLAALQADFARADALLARDPAADPVPAWPDFFQQIDDLFTSLNTPNPAASPTFF